MALFNSVLTSYSTKVNGQVIDASDVNNPQTDITQIEAILGVAGASSVVGTYEYLIKSAASDGGGHVQGVNKGGTNFTSYTKGDLLVGKSSSVLAKLAVGTDGQGLKADSTSASGVSWSNFPGTPTVRVYSIVSGSPLASVVATWNKPSVLNYIVVEVVGGGGGGGGGNGTAYCAGGGGGGYSRKTIPASSIAGTSASVITAGGGAGGSGASGSAGQNSSFNPGSTLGSVAAGGGTGGTGGAVSNTAGVAGGLGSGGDVNVYGGSSGRGGANATGATYGGFGGAAFFGGSINNTENNTNGLAGNTFGGGGSGSAGSGTTGGNGAQGIVIVYEY